MRLKLLYPKPLSEKTRPHGTDSAGRLAGFLTDSAPVLRNVRSLTVYLHEGLRDPRAVEGAPEWGEAWKRLDQEVARLKPIVAVGESFLGGPVPPLSRVSRQKEGYRPLEDKAEFPSDQGERLHKALVFAAYAQNLREYLIRKSAEAGADRFGTAARTAQR
jgi:hypothetical protein